MGNSKPRRRLRRRLAFAGLLLLLVATASELISLIGLLIVDGRIDFAEMQQERLQTVIGFERNAPDPLDEVLHPYLGFVLNAGHPETAKVAEQPVAVNQMGFRDQGDLFGPHPKNHRTIAVTGGSVAWYLTQDRPFRLQWQLDNSLDLSELDFQVVPLALSGYKQPQQLMTLSYLLALGARIDVVVNIDGFNEVALHPAENDLKDVFLAFPRGWHERVRELPRDDFVHTLYRHASLRLVRENWARRFSGFPYRYSPTLNLFWRCRDGWLRVQLDRDLEAITAGWLNKTRVYMHTGPAKTYKNDEEMYDELVGLWKRASLQMHQLCQANGIKYIHVLQPNQYFAGSKPMGTEERAIALDPNHKYKPGVVNGYPRLIAAGKELAAEGVEFVDLTMAFSKIREPIYIDNCCHYNDRGNALLAVEIALRIHTPQTDY